jgi:hypothetical protein
MDDFCKPYLKIELLTEVGDKTEFKTDIVDSTIWNVTEAFKQFLLACGYSPETVALLDFEDDK